MSVHVVVGRFDNNKRQEVAEGTTIGSAMNVAGYTKSDDEVIQDIAGNEYTGSEAVVDNTGYYLVQRVKSGQ